MTYDTKKRKELVQNKASDTSYLPYGRVYNPDYPLITPPSEAMESERLHATIYPFHAYSPSYT